MVKYFQHPEDGVRVNDVLLALRSITVNVELDDSQQLLQDVGIGGLLQGNE